MAEQMVWGDIICCRKRFWYFGGTCMKHKPVKTYYRWRKRRIVYAIATVLLIWLIPAIVMAVYSFHKVDYLGVKTPDYPYQNIYLSDDFKLASIGHIIETEDGETLWCSEIRNNAPEAVIIYLTDLKEPSVTYFYGHAAWMKEKGYSSFLLETRAHEKSSGFRQGLGIAEVEDVRALVTYIRGLEKYKKVPIIVQGLGVGGAAAISAAGDIPDVAACIAMSPWASAETQVSLIMKKFYIPGFLRAAEKPVLHQALRILYGKDAADNLSPEVQIQKADEKPMLIISAAEDPVVSVENTLILQGLSGDAEIWVRNSSNHFVVQNNDLADVKNDTEYCVYVAGFINKVIRNQK